jgi:hypothetical protein
MEKIIDYPKEWKNKRKVSKIIARRKGTNHDGNENEERRRRTDEDTPGI